jgi:hypothetical protein
MTSSYFIELFSDLLLIGALSLLLVLLFVFDSENRIGVFLRLIYLMMDLGLIVISLGLNKMRRWALFSYTVFVALWIVIDFIESPSIDIFIPIFLVCFLAYFWTVHKRFV